MKAVLVVVSVIGFLLITWGLTYILFHKDEYVLHHTGRPLLIAGFAMISVVNITNAARTFRKWMRQGSTQYK